MAAFIFQRIYSLGNIIVDMPQRGLTKKESFWPEWCSCKWNTGKQVAGPLRGVFYESDGEHLSNLLLWTHWTHLLIQVRVFGMFYGDVKTCCKPERIFTHNVRKLGRKPKKKKKKKNLAGVPVVAQWLTNPDWEPRGCRFDPWPCSVG